MNRSMSFILLITMIGNSLSLYSQHNNVNIIELMPSRWQEYKSLRLKGLTENSLAFGISPHDEEQYGQEVWESLLAKPTAEQHCWTLCAEINNQLVGIIRATREHGTHLHHLALITGFYVASEYQGKGIGKKLILELLTILAKNNIRDVYLWVHPDQKAALALYKSVGFDIVGTLDHALSVNGIYHPNYLMTLCLKKE